MFERFFPRVCYLRLVIFMSFIIVAYILKLQLINKQKKRLSELISKHPLFDEFLCIPDLLCTISFSLLK